MAWKMILSTWRSTGIPPVIHRWIRWARWEIGAIMPLTSLAQIGPNQESLIGHMFVVAEEMARREGVTGSGFRLVVNQGDDSGQEIAHLHMHLLGGQKLGAMG